jgi:hypothetical protein
VSEDVSIASEGEGGDSGGESAFGRGPGLQKGICLLGTAAGVPRCDVLMLRCGGGVAVRSTIAGAARTTVALMAHICVKRGGVFVVRSIRTCRV